MKLITLLIVCVCGCVYTQRTEFCSSAIYCRGQVLDVVQKSKVFQDSKSFVDMSQISHQNETIRHFSELMKNTKNSPTLEQIKLYVEENFIDDNGLEKWTPNDFNSNPRFIEKIEDCTVRAFAKDLVQIWPTLGRKVKQDVRDNPEKHSLLYLPNGFIIPGGRFKEMYYWDSYWIIKGLLLSGMAETARGILENFIYLIEKYGFVPNGSRIYYLNRSQPPLLALMVGLYMDYTNNVEWLQSRVGVLEKELKWWITKRVTVVRKDGKYHFLAHFSSEADIPRPESYYEDMKTCEVFELDTEKKKCYLNLRSGAESGWDFSSRWAFQSNNSRRSNLTNIQVTRIAPVDLNAYLCRACRELSRFYNLSGDTTKSNHWSERSSSWQKSIQAVFYDELDGIWYDYDITLSETRRTFYLSNFVPLWCETYDASLKKEYGSRVVRYLNKIGISEYKGGIPTSLKESDQQWDMPNAFPPLQEILILGLLQAGEADARELATLLAHRWISANIRSYSKNGVMFEKYNARDPEEFATGGEYTVQIGFGWTNGVALSLINEFYSKK